MGWYIVITIAVILIVGSGAALWWWKLAARIAPYDDEVDGPRGERERDHEVIVIGSKGDAGAGTAGGASSPKR